jgi:glutamate/tyrosine decarboxylase-like PLP-dependent enzyme
VTERELLARTAAIAADYVESLDARPVGPASSYREMHAALDAPLPDGPSEPVAVVEEMTRLLDPGITAMGSGRFFGFVIGGALPAAVAADWLVSTWDQNSGLAEPTPATAALETVAGRWVLELLGLPERSSFAFVTGCQMAHVTCLAAARHAVYARSGWNLPARGLAGARPLKVIVGGKRHVTVTRALRLLGIGAEQETILPADREGRMDVSALADAIDADTPTIVCAQAGEVSTGAFDDLAAVAELARPHGAWVHVDGAFGLWAAAAPSLRHHLDGYADADSWATDAHKWLNVPYDCGIAICAHLQDHEAAMEYAAPYLHVSDAAAARDPMGYSPEFSRRARSAPVWAAIRQLGRSGVAELVERCCAHARRFSEQIAELPGCEVVNEVVLNQVLFRFESDEATRSTLAAVQASGEAWMSGTVWDERAAIRLSVSGWRTTEEDIDRTVAAFAAALVEASPRAGRSASTAGTK